jgi:putative restriction endonuclease
MLRAGRIELSEGHARRLRWFEDRAGTSTRFPRPLDGGPLLVARPKGIYKPADLGYAVSVRMNLDSPYRDGVICTRADGTWYLTYHQENSEPGQRDREYTNRALMACMRDRVPVGVLRERPVAHGQPPEYDVLGLALCVAWRDGYFLLQQSTGHPDTHPDVTFQDVLEATAESMAEAEPTPPPADDYDARVRTYRQIVARRGQPAFRESSRGGVRG